MSRLLGAGQQKSSSTLLCVSFNQDASCISVGTRKGYSIWNAEPHGRVYSKNVGPTSIVEMLFCTSLVALVGTADSNQPNASPRRLQIVNTKRQSTICELLFPTAILGVKLNRRRLVVILEEEIYIYDISNMKLLHTIETSPNPQAICALSASSDPCYLVYPSPVPSPNSPLSNGSSGGSGSSSSGNTSIPGDVMIFDLLTLSVTNIIQAHKTPISALSLNQTGTLLATSSDKGTVIRVFSVPSAKKLWQFRRGSYPARIYSLNFNSVSTLLTCSSDTETVHIFKLVSSTGNGAGGANGNPTLAARSAALAAAAGGPSSPSLASADGSESPSDGGAAAGSGARGGYEAFIDDQNKSKKKDGLGGRPGGPGGGGLSGSIRRRSWALGKGISGSVGGFLPNSLSELWEPQRDFAHLKLPSPGVSSLVAVSSSTPTVMVVTSEGFYYSYNIDLEQGGECTLMRQYSLLDAGEDTDER